MRIAAAVLAIAVSLVLASCAAPVEPVPPPTPSVSEPELGALGEPGCRPPSPALGAEVQATGSEGVTAYGLMFVTEAGAIAADPATTLKMVVRMTGSGELAVHVTAPDDVDRPLDWGPERHGGSNFHRPGDEWGIGFTFDSPGCWQIALERDGGERADFWFDVGE